MLTLITMAMVATTGVAITFVPVAQGPRSQFNVPLSPAAARLPQVAAARRAYMAAMGATTAAVVALTLIPPLGASVWWLPLSQVIITFVGAVLWARARATALAARVAAPRQEIQGRSGSVAGARSNTCPPGITWQPYLMGALVAAATAAYIALNWDNIPQRFATHFNGSGVADGWTEKGPGVFFGQFMAAGLLTLGVTLSYFTAHKSAVRGAAGTKDVARKLAQGRASEAGLAWLMGLLSGALSLLGVAMPLSETSGLPPAGEPLWVLLILGIGLGGSLALVVATVIAGDRAAARTEESPGSADQLTVDTDFTNHVKWGLFYYNPDDPAVMVPKPAGVGLDFNYARWQAKAVMGLLALVTVASIALAAAG